MTDQLVSPSLLRTQVADDLATSGASGLSSEDRRELARQLVMTRLQSEGARRLSAGEAPLDPLREQQIAHMVLDSLFGLGRLQGLVDDPAIENIDVNGCDRVWVTYADGTKERVDSVADSDEELVEIIRSAAARFGLSERRFDTSHPELDLRLPDGSRLSALMAVVGRPSVSIRRHRYLDLSLSELASLGAMDQRLLSFLAASVRARKNIVIGGAMNSGKTTLVRALASEIPSRERIVTIEQAFELGLDSLPQRHPDMVALEARAANAEGEGEISMARLVRRALRMNADRVIVGEVMGDEVLPMLNAMSQGRSGSMCTIHADSSAGIFKRLATYAVQAPERLPLESTNLLISSSVHFAVFIDVRDGESSPCRIDHVSSWPRQELFQQDDAGRQHFEAVHRDRFISSVREVVDAEGLQIVSNEVFEPGPDGRAVPAAPFREGTLDDLVGHGYEPATYAGDGSRQWR
jgi:pilus assembly protein CpaF